jgi:hypothetical protein
LSGAKQANAVGVWGNHAIGVCHRVEGRARARYPAAALDHLAALRARPVVGGATSATSNRWLTRTTLPTTDHSEGRTACQAFRRQCHLAHFTADAKGSA